MLAGVGWFALVSQFALWRTTVGPLAAARLFTSYFSIVANVLAALVATCLAVRPRGAVVRSSLPTAVAVYVTIVLAIWLVFIRGSYTLSGLPWLADTLMHEVVPPGYILAWLLVLPRGAMRLRHTARWLILPFCYAVWMFACGAVDGWYPYPFLNPSAIGYPKSAAVTVVFVLLFWLVGLAYVGIDRWLATAAAPRNATPTLR